MYRRPKFLEVLLEIRREMSGEACHDAAVFAEMVRSGQPPTPPATEVMDIANALRPAAETEALLEARKQAVS